MASDGFTRVPHALLDALLLAELPRPQLLVVLAVARLTLGYGRASDEIGLTQLAAVTGMRQRTHAGRALRELVAKCIITRVPGQFRQVLSVNQNLAQWLCQSVTTQDTPSVTTADTLNGAGCDHTGHQSVTTQDTKPCPPGTHSIENRKKKRANARDGVSKRFAIFWETYPRKVAKKTAFKAFEKLNPDEQLWQRMLAALESAQRTEWRDRPRDKIPHAATWLNGERWEDEAAPISQQQPRLAL
jgi:phage replication O-like protein O